MNNHESPLTISRSFSVRDSEIHFLQSHAHFKHAGNQLVSSQSRKKTRPLINETIIIK